jgi:hypothetical protein
VAVVHYQAVMPAQHQHGSITAQWLSDLTALAEQVVGVSAYPVTSWQLVVPGQPEHAAFSGLCVNLKKGAN